MRVADFVLCSCLSCCTPRPGLPDGNIRGVTHHLNGGYIGLVINQTYNSGWRAYVRETKISVFPTNHTMLGVIIPPAAANVRLKYEPLSFRHRVIRLRLRVSAEGLPLATSPGLTSSGDEFARLCLPGARCRCRWNGQFGEVASAPALN
jgi:hypothetical protein